MPDSYTCCVPESRHFGRMQNAGAAVGREAMDLGRSNEQLVPALGRLPVSRSHRRLDLGRPRVLQNPKLDEQSEIIGTDPFADYPVTLEVHDVNHPVLYRPPGRRSPQSVLLGQSREALP